MENSFLKKWLRFLEWYCPRHLYESIEGDLVEQFSVDLKEGGEKYAKKELVRSVFRFMRPEIILRNKFSPRFSNNMMIANYVKVASRNIAKRKLYSFINAFGLSIGIAFCLFIYLYIDDEKKFDQFHENKDQIYGLVAAQYNKSKAEEGDPDPYRRMGYSQPILAPTLKSELAEVTYATRITSQRGIVRAGEKIFTEEVFYADHDFFKMFSFTLTSGNADKLFQNKVDVVVTPSFVKKYFGDEDPVGKSVTITTDEETQYVVAGVIEDPPSNSTFDFTIIVPLESARFSESKSWGSFACATFVQLLPGPSPENFIINTNKIIGKNMAELLARWNEDNKLSKGVQSFKYEIINLSDIHQGKVGFPHETDPLYTWILGGIALLILVIACINYISLALTASAGRKLEVGVRKTFGAHRREIATQFTFESVLLALLSAVFGLILVALFLPDFNTVTDKHIALKDVNIIKLAGFTLLATLITGAIAGSYPALFLSRYRPALVLKGVFTSKLKAGFVKPLVAFQFALSAFLIIGSIIMQRQMTFVTTRDLGYDQSNVLVVPLQSSDKDSPAVAERFKTELEKEPSVVAATKTNNSFNRGISYYWSVVYLADPGYIKTLGLQLLEGRNFEAGNRADSRKTVIVNESFVKEKGWKDPLNQKVDWGSDTSGVRIIGIVKDYHFASLQKEIGPLMLTMEIDEAPRFVLIKIQKGNEEHAIAQVKKIWTSLTPDKPFEFSFLKDDVANQYQLHERFQDIARLSTATAILIAGLGLFGLAGITTVNRTREIGIRKVLGAGVFNIFLLLNRQYVTMALISFSIATPFSWFVMSKWLGIFKYSIGIGWEIFAISLMAGLLVVLITVSYHAIRTALLNPADTLKYE